MNKIKFGRLQTSDFCYFLKMCIGHIEYDVTAIDVSHSAVKIYIPTQEEKMGQFFIQNVLRHMFAHNCFHVGRLCSFLSKNMTTYKLYMLHSKRDNSDQTA